MLDAYFDVLTRDLVLNIFINGSTTRFYAFLDGNPVQNTGRPWCETCHRNGPRGMPSVKCHFFDEGIRDIIYQHISSADQEFPPPSNDILRNRIITSIKNQDTLIPTCIYDKLHVMLPTSHSGLLDIRATTNSGHFPTQTGNSAASARFCRTCASVSVSDNILNDTATPCLLYKELFHKFLQPSSHPTLLLSTRVWNRSQYEKRVTTLAKKVARDNGYHDIPLCCLQLLGNQFAGKRRRTAPPPTTTIEPLGFTKFITASLLLKLEKEQSRKDTLDEQATTTLCSEFCSL